MLGATVTEPTFPVAWCSMCARVTPVFRSAVGLDQLSRCLRCDVALDGVVYVTAAELDGLGYVELPESTGCGCDSGGGCGGSGGGGGCGTGGCAV